MYRSQFCNNILVWSLLPLSVFCPIVAPEIPNFTSSSPGCEQQLRDYEIWNTIIYNKNQFI